MGFMDKAKKLAEQAQSRLDDVQQQFNESQGVSQGGDDGPVTEYDKHGRPVAPAPEEPAPPAPQSSPAAPRSDEYAPPPLTPGDPLKG